MKLKYKLSLLVIAILLAITTTIGSSYAIWVTEVSQSSTNVIKSGCFSLSFVDTENNVSTSINLKNAYPLTDDKVTNLKPYKVTITNTCSIKAYYELSLNTLVSNTLLDQDIKSDLTNTTTNTNYSKKILTDLDKIALNNVLNEEAIKKSSQINTSYLLANGLLNPEESVSYELKLWVKGDASNDAMNKKFEAIVGLAAYATGD